MKNFKAVWMSDLHIGNRNAKCELAIEFLSKIQCETLYLVGDIFDFEKTGFTWHWTQQSSRLIETIKTIASGDTRVVYLPGNHDIELRSYCGETAFGIEVTNDLIHTLPDGRRLLVIHGDSFEPEARDNSKLEAFGGHMYNYLLIVDILCDAWRKWLGKSHWSLAAWLKLQLPQTRRFIDRFGTVAIDHARKAGCDGVICGHLHHPEMRLVDNIWYCNSGDWVESCSAIVEDQVGNLRLVDYNGAEMNRAESYKTAVAVHSQSRA